MRAPVDLVTFTLAALLLAGGSAAAQESKEDTAPATSEPEIGFYDVVTVERLTIVARIVDARGQPILALGPEDLMVWVGDLEVPVQIAELGHFEASIVDQTIYHKNLRPLVYIYGELAGRPPAAPVRRVRAD